MKNKKKFIILILVILFFAIIISYLIKPTFAIKVRETTSITGNFVRSFFINFF